MTEAYTQAYGEVVQLVRDSFDRPPEKPSKLLPIVIAEMNVAGIPGAHITSYNRDLIPGDLQTPEYTQMVFKDSGSPREYWEVGGIIRSARGRLIAASMGRTAFIHEQALHYPLGADKDVLKGQLGQIAERAAPSNSRLEVRVISRTTPTDWLPPMNFQIMSAPDKESVAFQTGGLDSASSDGPAMIEEALRYSRYLISFALGQASSLALIQNVAANFAD